MQTDTTLAIWVAEISNISPELLTHFCRFCVQFNLCCMFRQGLSAIKVKVSSVCLAILFRFCFWVWRPYPFPLPFPSFPVASLSSPILPLSSALCPFELVICDAAICIPHLSVEICVESDKHAFNIRNYSESGVYAEFLLIFSRWLTNFFHSTIFSRFFPRCARTNRSAFSMQKYSRTREFFSFFHSGNENAIMLLWGNSVKRFVRGRKLSDCFRFGVVVVAWLPDSWIPSHFAYAFPLSFLLPISAPCFAFLCNFRLNSCNLLFHFLYFLFLLSTALFLPSSAFPFSVIQSSAISAYKVNSSLSGSNLSFFTFFPCLSFFLNLSSNVLIDFFCKFGSDYPIFQVVDRSISAF